MPGERPGYPSTRLPHRQNGDVSLGEQKHRGISLAIAIAIVFGASGGVFASRWSALAEEPPPVSVAAPGDFRLDLDRVRALATREPVVRRPAFPTTEPCGAKGARVIRFRVHVDETLDVKRAVFATAVRDVLCDRRGWTRSGAVRFAYHPKGEYLVSLRTAAATEVRCLMLVGLSVRRTYSCAGAREAVLNARRWFTGSPTLKMSVARYRALLVNHEVGHLIGHGHRGCSSTGAKAPVMMQQSKGLAGCRANEWPLGYERAAT